MDEQGFAEFLQERKIAPEGVPHLNSLARFEGILQDDIWCRIAIHLPEGV